MKIFQIGDIHIRDKDIEEIERCLNYIVSIAISETPDIIINTGDTFDNAGIKADSLSAKLIFRVFKELADIAPVVIIIGTSSHDGQVAETLQYIKSKHPVHVSTVPEQLYLCEGDIKANIAEIEAPDQAPIEAIISMVPAPTKRFFAHSSEIKTADMEIAAEMSKMFMGFATQASEYDCPHLLVGHWQTDGALVSEAQTLTGIDISLSKDQMALGNFNLICLGHLHLAQELKPNIFYSGSIISLTWGELEDKGFYIHEFKGKELMKPRFIKTPSDKRVKLSENLTDGAKLASLTGIPLMDMLLPSGPTNIQNAIVKVEIKVFQDEAQKINVKELEETLLTNGAKNVNVQLIRIPRENVRSQNILKLTTLRDKLAEMAALKNETVLETILDKADLLESEEADKIIQGAI